MLCAVRGAITVNEDTPGAIQEASCDLVAQLLDANGIEVSDIVSVIFTMTPDLKSYNPARAVRQGRKDWDQVAMLCTQEANIEKMLERCIRVLVQWDDMNRKAPKLKHVYLKEAQTLRPDL